MHDGMHVVWIQVRATGPFLSLPWPFLTRQHVLPPSRQDVGTSRAALLTAADKLADAF